ncbi:MAG TPA: hypothetical protein DEB31_11755 [Clostridiales bacterium]|nr:hypothetical protein [Clostridiales bacterium]
MKKSLPIMLILLAVAVVCAACMQGNGTVLSFSYSESSPGYKTFQKEIYVGKGMSGVSLDGTLSLSGGEAAVRVVDPQTDDILWEDTFTEGGAFTLAIDGLKPDYWYELVVNITHAAGFHLTLTTADSLVPKTPAPHRPERG